MLFSVSLRSFNKVRNLPIKSKLHPLQLKLETQTTNNNDNTNNNNNNNNNDNDTESDNNNNDPPCRIFYFEQQQERISWGQQIQFYLNNYDSLVAGMIQKLSTAIALRGAESQQSGDESLMY